MTFIDLLQYDFMRFAVIAAMLASVACGIIGTLVVTNRIVFIAGGIAHASFGGIGMAFYLGLEPLFGAFVFALGAAIAIGLVVKKSKERPDTAIGIIWAVGMAMGVVFKRMTPGYVPDMMSFIIGNMLTTPLWELVLMLAITLIIVGVVFVLFKEIQAVSFDEEYAKITGVPTFLIYMVMLVLISLSVIALIKLLGVILVIAMLSVPAAISGRYTHSLSRIMVYSIMISLFCFMSGLVLSAELGIETGATIVIVTAVLFAASTLVQWFRNRHGAARGSSA